ncbi:hypothetical protein [Archaeoglobus veneficus]|uniref:Uncharacterized protein n=1 Tax=Archaeoglobus veneficus (strain DSM 11195 / SNP6) TaxID=693661 RepID=F2KQJ6_ARCVS|nr:hypothetical protein [Archaeoglobus veneficus]AEA47729.1 hypothetical protein Arcve_1731 [Archaeoglobus veneficus SNP6]
MDNPGYEQVLCGPPHLVRLAELIYQMLVSKYSLEEIMALVAKHRNKMMFIVTSRSNPGKVSLVIDMEGKYRYSSGGLLFIPVPKKFAVLEPDKHYFEQTLKANILLAVLGVDEKELHR